MVLFFHRSELNQKQVTFYFINETSANRFKNAKRALSRDIKGWYLKYEFMKLFYCFSVRTSYANNTAKLSVNLNLNFYEKS